MSASGRQGRWRRLWRAFRPLADGMNGTPRAVGGRKVSAQVAESATEAMPGGARKQRQRETGARWLGAKRARVGRRTRRCPAVWAREVRRAPRRAPRRLGRVLRCAQEFRSAVRAEAQHADVVPAGPSRAEPGRSESVARAGAVPTVRAAGFALRSAAEATPVAAAGAEFVGGAGRGKRSQRAAESCRRRRCLCAGNTLQLVAPMARRRTSRSGSIVRPFD